MYSYARKNMLRALLVAALAAPALAANEVVEVSLGAPTLPYPQVTSAIASAESARKSAEAKFLAQLDGAYSQIVSQATAQVASIVRGRNSFLGNNPTDPTLELELVPSGSDEAAGAAAVSSLESKRSASEAARINQAVSELGELAKVILSEYSRAAGARKSFLEGSGREMNVKITTDSGFPTIASLAENMEARRDVAEDAVRARILDYQIRLAKSINSAARAALRG